jgi:pimeloyl-ACP methyl ester carboxylesterase
MKRQHHVIFVPGILDDIYHAQSALTASWRLHGVHGHCHEIPWAGKEPWEPKFQRLLDQIDDLKAQGHLVSLAGASAGASAVLNAYVQRKDKITGVAYICAKINGPETVETKTYRENPAFKTALYELQPLLKKFTSSDKDRFHSFYSPTDTRVPYAATVIPGVEETRLPALRHGRAILYALGPGAPALLAPLKRIAAKDA